MEGKQIHDMAHSQANICMRKKAGGKACDKKGGWIYLKQKTAPGLTNYKRLGLVCRQVDEEAMSSKIGRF